MKDRNSKLAFIGWFLVWLKDKDTHLVIKKEGDVVTISNDVVDNLKCYLTDCVEDYLLSNHCQFEEDFKNIRKQVISTFKFKDNVAILNIKNYKFTF